MPRYDYRCATCGSTFELNRPMSQANAPTMCPNGIDHEVRKLMSMVAVTGAASGGAAPAAGQGGGGGGCCGGGCCG